MHLNPYGADAVLLAVNLATRPATTPDELAYVSDRYRGLSPDTPVVTGRMTPVIGVHAGPGGIGIGCVSAPDDRSPDYLPA